MSASSTSSSVSAFRDEIVNVDSFVAAQAQIPGMDGAMVRESQCCVLIGKIQRFRTVDEREATSLTEAAGAGRWLLDQVTRLASAITSRHCSHVVDAGDGTKAQVFLNFPGCLRASDWKVFDTASFDARAHHAVDLLAGNGPIPTTSKL